MQQHLYLLDLFFNLHKNLYSIFHIVVNLHLLHFSDATPWKMLFNNMARLWNKKTAFHTVFLSAANKTGPGDTTIRNCIRGAKVIDGCYF
ncbi:hypothetical protein ACPA0F_02770 [Solibacillus silvestris]